MKKILIALLTTAALGVFFPAAVFSQEVPASASQTVRISPATSSNLVPGITTIEVNRPSLAPTPGPQPGVTVPEVSRSVDQEPVAVRKVTAAPAVKTKGTVTVKNKGQDGLEKAREEALRDAVQKQVQALRQERSQMMPYLDRVYISTVITPAKIQQKEEFLRGGPKGLKDLILRAEAVHTQTKAAQANIALSNRRVLYALRKLFPEVNLNMNERTGLLSSNPFSGKDWHISLRQPIFNGGVLWNTFLQEKATLEAAKKQYDKTIAELIFDLSRAYFEYQRTMQSVQENRATVDKMKRFADMSEEKFRENLISEIERLNVQSLYSQMQFDLESASQEQEIAELDLQKYLDLSVSDVLALKPIYDVDHIAAEQGADQAGNEWSGRAITPIFKDEKKVPELVKLIDLSYGGRPELQVEAAKLQATRLGEKIRWGEFLPKVFLTYDYGKLGEAYTGSASQENYVGPGYVDEPQLKKEWRLFLEVNWNAGGNKVNYTLDRDNKAPSITQYQQASGTVLKKQGLNVGVLDGLDAFVNVKQAEVDKLNQVVELEKAEKQVLQDVKQAFYDYQKSLIQVRSTVKRMEYRKRLRDFVEHRLSQKEVEISEYLQAEADLVRERTELHRALKDYFTAKAALNHAIGIQDYLDIESPHGR